MNQNYRRDSISNNRSENRISIICFDAFNHENCDDRDDHVETMDRQDRRNRPIKFLSDGGDCDDRDDHMETRLKMNFNGLIIQLEQIFWKIVSIFRLFLSESNVE